MNPRTRRSSLPGPPRFLPAFVLGATFCLPISAQQMRTLPAGETARFEAADALSDMDAASIPNGPTPEAVRSLYATIDMQHKSLRPLLDRWGKARRQLELMPEASNAALLEHLLQEIKDYLDPANLIGQKQEMERRLAVPDVAGAYEALLTYAKQREADRPVAWGRVDYVDLRLRTQEKAARLERIAAATGGPAPLGDAIALLERNLATREQDMTQPLPRFARTAELEGLLKLYDTAYDDVQRRAAEVASRQPHGALQDHKSTRGCADATPDEIARSRLARERTAPKLDLKRSAPTDIYYPPDSRRLYSEGVTSLRAFVAASGCVARAQVVGTSGDPKLDAAAVRWVLEGAVFSPGTANGAPAAIATMFNVRFKLTD